MDFDISKLIAVGVILAFAGLLWFQDQAFEDQVGGIPRIVDGDSLELNNEKIRLKGIDAPEGRQFCEKNGKNWACGKASTTALRKLISGQKVKCDGNEYDRHKRLLAFCYVNDLNLNKNMVENGWAVSYGSTFKIEELAAKNARKGIWQGTFEWPREWRRKHPRY